MEMTIVNDPSMKTSGAGPARQFDPIEGPGPAGYDRCRPAGEGRSRADGSGSWGDVRLETGEAVGHDPREEYARRRSEAMAGSSRLAKLDDLAGYGRLAVFVTALGLAGLAWRGDLGWAWAVAAGVGFVPLVYAHGRVVAARRRAEGVAAYHERGLARLDDRWAGTGVDGAQFRSEDHPYAVDLDLFGAGSLFERLCAARTTAGEATLAAWLLEAAEPDEIRARHQAIAELRPRLGFREDLALLGDEVRSGVAPESLASWGATPQKKPSAPERGLVALVALATVGSVAGWVAEVVDARVMLALIAVEVVIAYGYAGRSRRALAEVEERAGELATLAAMLGRVERERFESPRLREIHAALIAAGRPASRRIADLAGLIGWLASLHNVFFALFGALLLWRTQFALAIERWRSVEGPAIGGWLDAIGRLEALASLASFAFDNPDDPFPELAAEGPCLEGEGVGHPLLPASRCVRNDIRLGPEARVLAVSGSNMSGKSTWLRTLGVNAVLAQAGAPVRARRFRLSPLAIGGTLGVHDSLQAGRSRFYAEILRLRQLVDLAGRPSPPLFFLIDEVLHGTNSADRLVGAEAVVRALVDRGAIGLFTTHDLSLAEVADRLGPIATNVHFADHVGPDGRLAFDYTMRPGVVRQSNALALMRAVGLDV